MKCCYHYTFDTFDMCQGTKSTVFIFSFMLVSDSFLEQGLERLVLIECKLLSACIHNPGLTTPVITFYFTTLYTSPVIGKTRNKNLKRKPCEMALVRMPCVEACTMVRIPSTPREKFRIKRLFFLSFVLLCFPLQKCSKN